MKKIGGAGNEDYQTIEVTNFDGAIFNIELFFRFATNYWYLTVTTADFSVRNMKVVMSPNLLRQYSAYFNFGIACIVDDGVDPRFIDDFQVERASLYLLDADDVAAYEESLSNG